MSDPRSVDVTLDIKNQATQPTGYTQAKSDAAGTTDLPNYWYKYSDGDDGNGNVIASTEGQEVNISVGLSTGQGGSQGSYKLSSAAWKTDHAPGGTDPDISLNPTPTTQGNKILLTDSATIEGESVQYTVMAVPNPVPTPAISIYCDPSIQNEWSR